MGHRTGQDDSTRRRTFLRAVGAAGAAGLLSQSASADGHGVLADSLEVDAARPQDVLVVVDDESAIERVVDRPRVDGYHRYETLPIVALRVAGDELRDLARVDGVRRITPNREVELYNHDSQEDTNAREVWESGDLGYTGENVEVAIIDTGLDGTHPAFGDALEANYMWAGDPFSGDVEWVDVDPATADYLGHGTHCAGSMCGNGDGSVLDDYTGMAPGATLTSYAWPALVGTEATAIAAYDHILAGKQAGDNDIQLVSNSWGLPDAFHPDNPVTVAVYEAFKAGVLSVFAAGNSGPDPDTMAETQLAPFVLSIAGTNADMSAWDTSSRGVPDGSHDRQEALRNCIRYYEEGVDVEEIDGPLALERPAVGAKGNAVVSAQSPDTPLYATGKVPTPIIVPPNEEYIGDVPEHVTEYGAEPLYIPMSGTSMACPTTAGCVTLFLDAYYEEHGEFPTPIDTINAIEATGREAVDESYNRVNIGAGYVDAKAAVEAALDANGLPDGLDDRDELPPGLQDGLPPGLAKRDDGLPGFDDVVLAKPYPEEESGDEGE